MAIFYCFAQVKPKGRQAKYTYACLVSEVCNHVMYCMRYVVDHRGGSICTYLGGWFLIRRFSMSYLYVYAFSAFPNCTWQTEPGTRTVAQACKIQSAIIPGLSSSVPFF
jgi:hypothetical protein